jgi:hypothetical protein
MSRFLAAALSALLLAACGGSDTSSGLNPAFSGTWQGDWTVSTDGGVNYGPLTNSTSVGVSASGSSGVVSPACPYGQGTIIVSGTGNTATWSGYLPCGDFPFPGYYPYYSSEFTLTAASLVLSTPGTTLRVQGTGIVRVSSTPGLAAEHNVTILFVGQK